MLLSIRDVSVSYGGPRLLEGATFHIHPGDRVCLLGRNGTGKSTLMKLIHGDILPDSGVVDRKQDMRVAMLGQEVPKDTEGLVYDVVASGLGNDGVLLSRYQAVARELAIEQSPELLARLEEAQHELESAGAWNLQQRVESVLSRLSLDALSDFTTLSGGMKRRVFLARALVTEPDLLMLDEPTNHLDTEAIIWMEDFLLRYSGTLLFVTHDRVFLRKLATRIVEIDRGVVKEWAGNYDTYLEQKEAALESETRERERFDKKLAQEEVWIRRGVQARRTRNEGRVRALEKLRQEYSARRNRVGQVKLKVHEGPRSGKEVIDATGLSYSYDGSPLIDDFSAVVMRGDKLGIMGPNGSGKTTLVRLLTGELKPHAGSVRLGTNMEVAYFDQLRAQLDEEKSVQDNLADGHDTVLINGQSRHVVSYLGDFLFSGDRARTPVKALSGGERNRLLLAKLFARSSNVLILDEPTNDLDVETLELLESLLADYSGTVLLVSHDRAFLNNVVTSTLVLEGAGKVNAYVGGYDDWVRQRTTEGVESDSATKKKKPRVKAEKPRRLSFKEKKELEELPLKIEALEAEQSELHSQMSDSGFYQSHGEKIPQMTDRLQVIEGELELVYARWEELDAIEA